MATTSTVGGVTDPPLPQPRPYNILNRLTLADTAERWESGIAFESIACAATIETTTLCGPPQPPITEPDPAGRGVYAPVFGITATDTCTSTFGKDSRDRAAERVTALLEAATPKAIEHELLHGTAAQEDSSTATRWLTAPTTTIINSTGVEPRIGAALLEDAYAACSASGGGGTLHTTPGTAALLRRLTDDDGVLTTPTGTPIIIGAGYTQPPDGWDGTWMFITGPVKVWLGEPTIYPDNEAQAITPATNDITFKAERLAAVTYDGCCTFAVRIDLTKATT